MFDITPLTDSKRTAIQQKIDQKTKPPGALGRLEQLAMQLALITGSDEIILNKPTMLVFAADHGIAKEGVSIAPPEVTQQMVLNFLNGGAAINCFCRANDIALEVIDAGILVPINAPKLTMQSLGRGTNNFVTLPAMSLEAVTKGFSLGAKVVYRMASEGCNVFGFGEMGIGNTSSASALMSAITGIPAEECVGRGTGISDEVYQKKLSLIQKALKRHKNSFDDTKQILSALGGFEIVQMVGAMLAAAECNSVVLVDGFIATVAALAAVKINPAARDYMVFCHQSEESGHQKLLQYLQATPLLSLELRLGEGTGAALAVPLLKAAQAFYNDMASFDSAGVDAV
ncbi:nicotinate-nucleotide--dimethylbenzimidazole phosphoribosyltransferase [Aliikangiella coralliicola]|uniref:Nicotinate-nucleotide--dimethylbenzimidazole phosphoribosyltransferase n=1 Tax=Aliikangiella coralliicola TaxID=2592383 RepID=A0A545UJH7_9GAMM|nr:nicotinate-nucleotide--dimethylbenzimidazole phosphoribosyltransferase [Aliikangiella coralliicola]TQV89618.1 nicotinate-nucleotide--dimethylbenzimidazole phosphoribosyltransferase [Aliikangiella coralliicola]